MELPPHHVAWLSAHPHRTEEWFRQQTKDGFDVHHLDGNHDNNDPRNLVLIEHTDHMALHNGGSHTMGRLKPKTGPRKPRQARRRPSPRIVRAIMDYEKHKAKLAAYCAEIAHDGA